MVGQSYHKSITGGEIMTYTLVNFKSNNNSSNWQQDYIGQEFTVQGAELGLSAIFTLVDGSGRGLRTSTVVNVASSIDGGLIVATRNSTYEFEAVK